MATTTRAFLASIGFNAVRVGVIWKAVEPRPGVYNTAYLNRIAGTVRTLARHGIVSGRRPARRTQAGLPHQLPRHARALARLRPLLGQQSGSRRRGPPEPLRRRDLPGAGFAFHDYCFTPSPNGCKAEEPPFTQAMAHVRATHEAVLLTEFGATNAVADLTGMVARADHFMLPWLEWAYCGCSDPTTAGPGNIQAIVINPARPPAPALVYRGHYAARVSGGAIVSRRGAPTLRVASCPGARRVFVTVRPSGRNRSSCAVRTR